MTTPVTTVELCPDCGRPLTHCFFPGEHHCLRIAIASLRAQLADWQERNREMVTERDDVEVALDSLAAREKLASLRADEARALLQRMVKYAREYNTVPYGTAKLGSCVDEVADYLQRTHDPNSILREKP